MNDFLIYFNTPASAASFEEVCDQNDLYDYTPFRRNGKPCFCGTAGLTLEVLEFAFPDKLDRS